MKIVYLPSSIIAELKNGEEKGKLIHLTNEYSSSGAYDQEYHVGNELFVSIDTNTEENSDLTGTIKDVKRDKYVLIVAWIFILTLTYRWKKARAVFYYKFGSQCRFVIICIRCLSEYIRH